MYKDHYLPRIRPKPETGRRFQKCEFEYAAVCWVLKGFGVGWGKEGERGKGGE